MMTNLPKGCGAVSDGADTNAKNKPMQILTNDTRTLIVYFSRSGNTEAQATFAQETLTADMVELVVESPYPANYRASVERATAEREPEEWPAIITKNLPDFSKYDNILLGHPIWAMTIANPMRQFLETVGDQLAGKTVTSFSTNAGYGNGDTQMVLQALLPKSAKILPGYTIHDTKLESTRDQFKNWLLRLPID
ncbi:flavodoxin family protein [Secundilactobacillus malefermentans]|nr:flavodoxin [Secundilactobacillus malefermentans]